jgi:hypothetical protein
MKRYLFQAIATIAASIVPGVYALGTADLLSESPSGKLLDKKCISTETSGLVPVQFESASGVLMQPNLVQLIQQEYAQSVSSSQKVLYPITATAPGQFHYFNRKGQRTEVIELYRKQTDEGTFDYIVQASGKRFFGRYDVIIHLQVVDAAEAGVAYTAEIHAYPHNGALRFFARKLGTVERYFKKNTGTITSVAKKVGEGLCTQTAFSPVWTGGLLASTDKGDRSPSNPTLRAAPPTRSPAQSHNLAEFFHSSL